MKYRVLWIIALLLMLNIIFIPFLCNRFWSLETEHSREQALYFSDTIEELVDGYYSDDDVPIDILYYFVGLACALFIFICALRKSSGACILGSLVGVCVSLYLFYEIYIGSNIWYVCGNNAHLTFGYYISCVGFISMLIASLVEEKQYFVLHNRFKF